MRRWAAFLGCVVLGLLALAFGWLVPVYLRAVDASVLQRAGRNTLSPATLGVQLGKTGNAGAVQMLLEASREAGLRDQEQLDSTYRRLMELHPAWAQWGGGDSKLQPLFEANLSGQTRSEPLTQFAIKQENREAMLGILSTSTNPAVKELLRSRALTNTALLPPSSSASGQAFDAAVCVGGLLLENEKLTPKFGEEIYQVAAEANRRGNSQPLEQLLLDFLSLGQRFNWGQLVVVTARIEDAETLRRLAGLVRQEDGRTPLIFSAVALSERPVEIADYLITYGQTGVKDLGASLRYGAGGVRELLRRNERLFFSTTRQQMTGTAFFAGFFDFAADYCWRSPGSAIILKWLLYLAGGFLLAAAIHFARPASPALERPLQVRGFHIAREFLFALGFLLVVLVLSEPFLAQESQRAEVPFRLRLPAVGGAVPAIISKVKTSLMNPTVTLTMLLFFVLQGLLYVASVVKLAEIRRQRVPARVQLKLLENEEHLFDAGLYLGLLGTIVSFILVYAHVFKDLSLMAAYSSTSFGIMFVVIFKIFHLRPTRRRLVMESETQPTAPVAQGAMPSYVQP